MEQFKEEKVQKTHPKDETPNSRVWACVRSIGEHEQADGEEQEARIAHPSGQVGLTVGGMVSCRSHKCNTYQTQDDHKEEGQGTRLVEEV